MELRASGLSRPDHSTAAAAAADAQKRAPKDGPPAERTDTDMDAPAAAGAAAAGGDDVVQGPLELTTAGQGEGVECVVLSSDAFDGRGATAAAAGEGAGTEGSMLPATTDGDCVGGVEQQRAVLLPLSPARTAVCDVIDLCTPSSGAGQPWQGVKAGAAVEPRAAAAAAVEQQEELRMDEVKQGEARPAKRTKRLAMLEGAPAPLAAQPRQPPHTPPSPTSPIPLLPLQPPPHEVLTASMVCRSHKHARPASATQLPSKHTKPPSATSPAPPPLLPSQPHARSAAQPASLSSVQPSASPQMPPLSVWFEVSANTGRLHCHLAPHGGCMLGLNLPADLLLLPPQHHQPTLRALCSAYARLLALEQQQLAQEQQHLHLGQHLVQSQQQQQQQQQSIPLDLGGQVQGRRPPPCFHVLRLPLRGRANPLVWTLLNLHLARL